MSDYLPAGVTDAHPHFNPPRESATAVECGNDAVDVIPGHAVKNELNRLRGIVEDLRKHAERLDMPWAKDTLAAITYQVDQSFMKLEALEAEAEFDCPFKDEMDLPESECAIWQCPVCGNARETDNLPEDRDPDEERYDYDD